MGYLLTLVARFFVSESLLKFLKFAGLVAVVGGVCGYIAQKLPGVVDVNSALGNMTPGVWYFLDYTLFPQAFPGIISAYILRWNIKRLTGLLG